MKFISMLVLALTMAASPVFAQTATRTPDQIMADIEATAKGISASAAALNAKVAELKQALTETRVADGDNLQVALNGGGVVRLAQGATFAGSYILKPNTTLLTEGAKFSGSTTGPTLYVPPGTDNVYVSGFTFAPTGTVWDQQVILIGRNDSTQNTLALVPEHITIIGANIPSYRGKRAIDVNGADVKVLQSLINDAWDLAGRDSQAIGVLNTPGPVLIDHNDLSAGSENILVGGDTMKIPGVYPTGITITNNHIWRPLSWQTDGINRGVKNLIELKTGRNVLIKGNVLDGCWKQAQDGYAIVITPRQGGDIHDVLIEDNTADHVGAGFNILGRDDGTGSLIPTPAPISNLVVRRFKLNASAKVYLGRGILALITGTPHDVTFDDITGVYDGNSVIQMESQKILNPDGTLAGYKKMASLVITNSRLTTGVYGFFLTGQTGGANWTMFLDSFVVTGNTFVDPTSSGARSSMHNVLPNNTYVDRPTFDALIAGL